MLLPPSVRRVGVKTFYECVDLKTLTLNEGLETIGESAFERTSLEGVSIPDTVERLSSSVFCDCENLRNIELQEGLWEIGEKCFSGTAI